MAHASTSVCWSLQSGPQTNLLVPPTGYAVLPEYQVQAMTFIMVTLPPILLAPQDGSRLSKWSPGPKVWAHRVIKSSILTHI